MHIQLHSFWYTLATTEYSITIKIVIAERLRNFSVCNYHKPAFEVIYFN